MEGLDLLMEPGTMKELELFMELGLKKE